MFNPYHPEPAKIIKITPQTADTKLFRFEFTQKVWGYNFNFKPGQFVELSILGFGEAPFAPCNAPGTKYLELCVRNAGKLTDKLHLMKIGDKVGIRGPYGNGWPFNRSSEAKLRANAELRSATPKNALFVVGGLGLIPLRALILAKEKFLDKDAKIQIFYGVKTPAEFLFRDEFGQWRKKGIELQLTVDKECPGWDGCLGVVTTLFDKQEILPNAAAFLCGPPMMYKFVLEKLAQKQIPESDIYLSLERRMHCGLGVCQHCAVGPYYACKDGPVFRYDQIKDIPGAI